MEEKQVSRTALMSAYIRGYHAAHDAPKVFDDFLAYRILTDGEREFFDQRNIESLGRADPDRAASFSDRAGALAWIMRVMGAPPIMLARARYVEDSVEEHAARAGGQYVLLGAGLDTFAFRRPDLLERLQVFELDHPGTQAHKRNRLAELGWAQPAQLHFIPVDFTRDSLAGVLGGSPYDSRIPGLFSWLGVTYYLPREAVLATLRGIAGIAPAGTQVIFDFLDRDAFDPRKVSPRVQLMLNVVQQAGEPVQSGFDPTTLAADLDSAGLHLHEHLSPTDIQKRFFEGRRNGYRATEHFHLACAVVE